MFDEREPLMRRERGRASTRRAAAVVAAACVGAMIGYALTTDSMLATEARIATEVRAAPRCAVWLAGAHFTARAALPSVCSCTHMAASWRALPWDASVYARSAPALTVRAPRRTAQCAPGGSPTAIGARGRACACVHIRVWALGWRARTCACLRTRAAPPLVRTHMLARAAAQARASAEEAAATVAVLQERFVIAGAQREAMDQRMRTFEGQSQQGQAQAQPQVAAQAQAQAPAAAAVQAKPPPPKKEVAGDGGYRYPSLKSKEEREKALGGEARTQLSVANDLDVPADLRKLGIERGKDVFVTFATGSLKAFAFNWVHYVQRSNLSPYMIGALDTTMYDLCVAKGIPTYMVNGSDILTKRDVTYFKPGSPVFKKMGTVKTKFILEMLRMGLNPILSDADVMWLRDPREHFKHGTYSEADVLISTDCIDLPADHRDEGGCAHVNFNTGILHFKATDKSREFVRKWHETIVSHLDQRWMRDQPAFNLLIRDETDIGLNWKNAPKPPEGERRVFEVATGTGHPVRLGPLPSWLFVGGHVYFVQELMKHWDEGPSGLHFDEKPYALHMTYQYGDSGEYPWGKRQRLRSLGMWQFDPPSYYSEGKFITVAPEAVTKHLPPVDVPRGVDSRIPVKLHLEEDAYRRPAIQSAFAVAQALNRTLVLPRMYCYADNIWNKYVMQQCRECR